MPTFSINGKLFTVDGDACVIGSGPGVNLRIKHPSVDPRHARVFLRDGAWLVEDLLSANGTAIGGRALVSGAAPVADGETIRVGKIAIVFDPKVAGPILAPFASAATVAALVGADIQGYRIQRLERRAMGGAWYAASHQASNRDVRFWAYDPELCVIERVGFHERLSSWLGLLAAQPAAEVMRIYQCGLDQGRVWYAGARIAGAPLPVRLDPPAAIALVQRFCRVMQTHHDIGAIHGHLAPATTVIDRAGDPRPSDLGLIGISAATRVKVFANSPVDDLLWICPVQARTGEINVLGDIYAIGCLLCQLLTGSPPYAAGEAAELIEAHAQQAIPQPATALGLPPRLDRILRDCLAKDPQSRYHDAMRLAADLDELAEETRIVVARAEAEERQPWRQAVRSVMGLLGRK